MAEPELNLRSLRLGALPEFDPPPQLWERIEQAHGRRQRQRRVLRWGSALAACLALAAVMALAPQGGAPQPDPLVHVEQRSHELEQIYAGLASPSTPLESELELHAVELALQQAYDRGAAAAELLPLWQQRNELLSSLIALSADGARLTRI